MIDRDSTDDEALLARFRQWLRDARAEADGLNGDQAAPSSTQPEVGLYRVVEEFTAFRHEIKLETKSSRNLQEQIETLLPVIRQAIDHFRSVVPKEEQAASSVAKPLVEAMADLDEALARGRLEIEKARDRLIAEADAFAASIESDIDQHFRSQSWFRRYRLRSYYEQVRGLLVQRVRGSRSDQFDALLEGYGLIQSRLNRSMLAGQIRRIDTVGQPVDPALMTVIEVVDAPDQPAGHVVDEVRRGYTWRGRVLRYAEVRAARERAIPEEEVDEIEDEGEGEVEEDEFEDADEPEPGVD